MDNPRASRTEQWSFYGHNRAKPSSTFFIGTTHGALIVIPVETGIQTNLDSRFSGNDKRCGFVIHNYRRDPSAANCFFNTAICFERSAIILLTSPDAISPPVFLFNCTNVNFPTTPLAGLILYFC